MLFNDREYNPLEVIFKYSLESPINTDTLNMVQHELNKGGIVAETTDECKSVLHLLIELQKEYYGKK